jgi:hypothetical protein
VTLFPAAYQKFGHLIRSAGPYLVEGRVEEQFGAVTLRAERLQEMPQAKRAAGAELRGANPRGANPRGANPLSTPARGARMQAGRR